MVSMRIVIAAMLCSLFLFQPAIAKQATNEERKAMSIEVANYIHDPYGEDSHPRAFGGSSKI